jgi:hypothetical protein
MNERERRAVQRIDECPRDWRRDEAEQRERASEQTSKMSRSQAHQAILLILTSIPRDYRFTDAADDILDAIWPQPSDLSDYTNQELFDAYNAARQWVDLIAIETEKRFH